MRNLWIQPDWPFVTWTAELDALRGDPRALLELVLEVIELGEQTEVFSVVKAPAIGFDRERGEDLRAILREEYARAQQVDAFSFMGAAMAPGAPNSSTARARLAWYDERDQLTRGWICDLGALLSTLEPVPGSMPTGFCTPLPPVRITGPRIKFEGQPPTATRPPQRPLRINVALHSDIWFPWVFGSAHPEADHRRMFDNRALAKSHTPRLNAFIAGVASRVRARGGAWSVDLDSTGSVALAWVDEEGIDTDLLPDERMPADALDVEWF